MAGKPRRDAPLRIPVTHGTGWRVEEVLYPFISGKPVAIRIGSHLWGCRKAVYRSGEDHPLVGGGTINNTGVRTGRREDQSWGP
jgi:hypothetical protein